MEITKVSSVWGVGGFLQNCLNTGSVMSSLRRRGRGGTYFQTDFSDLDFQYFSQLVNLYLSEGVACILVIHASVTYGFFVWYSFCE